MPKNQIPSPDEALKRYLADSNAAEEVVASQIGNHHTLRRWLSDKESSKKRKLALAAVFLRQSGILMINSEKTQTSTSAHHSPRLSL